MRNLLFLIILLSPIFAIAQEQELLWEMQHLGTKVNSRFHDSAPIISPDGKTLYFFVANHPEKDDNQRHERGSA